MNINIVCVSTCELHSCMFVVCYGVGHVNEHMCVLQFIEQKRKNLGYRRKKKNTFASGIVTSCLLFIFSILNIALVFSFLLPFNLLIYLLVAELNRFHINNNRSFF